MSVKDGKRFPFYHHSQVNSVNGSIHYPCWKLYGDFRPKETYSSPNCPDVLLQVGGQEPQPKGPQFDQGGPDDPGHGSNIEEGWGEEQTFETPLDNCEFEGVCEVAKLLENWSDLPMVGPADHQWSLHCVPNVLSNQGLCKGCV